MPEGLWWVPSPHADFVFAPTSSRAMPAVVAELRKGVGQGFPALRACVTMHGIGLEGVNPTVLPELFAVVGLNSPSHGLHSVGRGPIATPSELPSKEYSTQGPTWKGGGYPALLIDEATLAATQMRIAVANILAQPCTPSLVAIERQDRQGQQPARLIRLLAVTGPAVTRLLTEGLHLRVAGNMVKARPAPPTQALDEGATFPNNRHATATELQRTWDPERSPAYAPVYLGTTPKTRRRNCPGDVRRMREAT